MRADKIKTALAADAFDVDDAADTTDALIIMGLVDDTQAVDATLAFSPAIDPSHWIPLPTSLVERVLSFGDIPVGDDSYKLVAVELAEPTSPEMQFAFTLLNECLDEIDDHTAASEINVIDALSPDPDSEASVAFGFGGWKPPKIRWPKPPKWTRPRVIRNPLPDFIRRASKFSKCAKCKMYTNLIITGIVAAAGGPSNIAAIKLALAKKFGEAAMKAAASALVSGGVDAAAKAICKHRGAC